ncbi:putative adenylate kinase-like protein [Bacillus phage vB_BanH_Emiliahah]|nr:putative adenylate kinase-like protein [Bacillus phage vB_BanH_Emiliahah]
MTEVKLAIAGELRSGKTTLEKYAVDTYGVVPFAFATELKAGFHYEYPHIPREPKPREGYQLYGQLKRYVFGADYWIGQCAVEIENIRRAAAAYNITGSEIAFCPLITDVKQPNEFAWCRKEGYKIIKLLASEDVRVERSKAEGDKFDKKNLYHESELHIHNEESDFVIYNNGTLEDLYAQFDEIMTQIKGEQLNG